MEVGNPAARGDTPLALGSLLMTCDVQLRIL